RLVVTLEEHSLIGGLGGAVAEWLVDREVERTGAVPGSLPGAGVEAKAPVTHVRGSSMSSLPGAVPGAGARLLRVGTMDQFFHEAGEQEHYRGLHGLTVPAITERVLRALGNGAAKPRLETTGVFGRTFSGGGVH
ncbi:MAG: hypothetical protein IT443_05750, partial [Phycisphaeraceae bacterium]|nr:hypothetical protein [Phycisphaeraceae bacterium]